MKTVDLLPLAASIEIALIRLASYGDLGVFVVLFVFLLLGLVTGWSGGSNGQDSDENELVKFKQMQKLYCLKSHSEISNLF